MELCAKIAELRDAVLLDLIREALADLNESGPDGLLSQIALAAQRRLWPARGGALQRRGPEVLYPFGLGDARGPLCRTACCATYSTPA